MVEDVVMDAAMERVAGGESILAAFEAAGRPGGASHEQSRLMLCRHASKVLHPSSLCPASKRRIAARALTIMRRTGDDQL